MTRRRKSRRERHHDPEAILAGYEDIDGEDLFRLIHRVNPTGRNLEKREGRRLYGQKSRLQSLLVRRFSELVVVEPSGEEGVASLGHRSGQLDACHAVVDDLEPDARSWVRLRLDLAASPEVPEKLSSEAPQPFTGTPADAEPANVLVARAEQAMGKYEYDLAESYLVRALRQSSGALEAALPLLELRVELLGMDAEALAAGEHFDARARESPRVRALLALAAARRDEEDRSLELLRGLPRALSVEAWVALAQSAVRRGEPAAARRFVAEIERVEPPHPGLDELRRAVQELVADNLRPVEEQLARRFQAEGALAAEDEARGLIARWPASEVARSILHEASEIKRRGRLEEALRQAEAATATEHFREAEKFFRAALEAGGDAELSDRADEARRLAEAREDEERLNTVAQAFATGNEEAALLAYLALTPHLRRRSRQALGLRPLEWLEEAGVPSGAQHVHATVAAILALGRALTTDADEPQRIVDELTPHMKTLRSIADARKLRGAAEKRLAEERGRRARAALDAARQAADRGHFNDTGYLLAEIAFGDLDGPGRQLHDELLERQHRAEEYDQAVHEYERHLAKNELLDARDRAQRLVEIAADEARREPWCETVQDLRGRIRQHWAVEIDTEPRPLSEIRDFLPPAVFTHPEAWLDDDGDEMILADIHCFWLFIRVVDVAGGRLVEQVSLQAMSLYPPCKVWRDGHLVRIADRYGQFLELHRDGWEVLRWRHLRQLIPETSLTQRVLPIPGSDYLWFKVDDLRSNKLNDRVVILDLEHMRLCRQPNVSPAQALLQPAEPRVVCGGERSRIFEARGVERSAWNVFEETLASPAPDGRLLLAEPGETGAGILLTLRHERGSQEDQCMEIRGGRFEPDMVLATRLSDGLAFLVFDNDDGGTDLMAVSLSQQGIVERYRVPLSTRGYFIQDRWGKHLVIAELDGDQLRLRSPGPEAPRLPTEASTLATLHEDRRVPPLQGPHGCAVGSQSHPVVLFELRHLLGEEPFADPSSRERFLIQLGSDPDTIVNDLLAILDEINTSGLIETLQEARERFPESSSVVYALATLATEEEDWQTLGELLAAVDSETVASHFRRHFHHLQGLLQLTRGRWREARECFKAGDGEIGGCQFHQLLELTEILELGELGEEDRQPESPLTFQVCSAIQAADRALSTGRFSAVVAELDRPAVWSACEVQSAARLATAHLETEAATPAALFNKRRAIAFFLDAHRENRREDPDWEEDDLILDLPPSSLGDARRRNLDIAPMAWDVERLNELAQRARDWLVSQADKRRMTP